MDKTLASGPSLNGESANTASRSHHLVFTYIFSMAPQAAVVFREPLKCCDGLSGAPMPLIRPPNPTPAHSSRPIDLHGVPIQPCRMAEGQGLIPRLASRNLSENVAVLSTCGTWFCGNRSKRAGEAVSLQRLTWRREQLVVRRCRIYMESESESCSVMSNSLWPHGLSMEFSRPEYWSG